MSDADDMAALRAAFEKEMHGALRNMMRSMLVSESAEFWIEHGVMERTEDGAGLRFTKEYLGC